MKDMEDKKMVQDKDLSKASGGSARCTDDPCPKCGSSNVKMLGFIADGEIVNFRCQNCGHYWEELA